MTLRFTRAQYSHHGKIIEAGMDAYSYIGRGKFRGRLEGSQLVPTGQIRWTKFFVKV